MAGYDLELNDKSTMDFNVMFHGPKERQYEHLELLLKDSSALFIWAQRNAISTVVRTKACTIIFVAASFAAVYEGGVWKIHVILPEDYPFASPSVGFATKIMHPNVDEASGSVCLDVINQTWTPLYTLLNIFDTFIPQLLTYPNPQDPLNSEAASLLNRDKELYEQRVKEHVARYASRESYEVDRARRQAEAERARQAEAEIEAQQELEGLDEDADGGGIEDL
ncbi:hypothetical protein ACSSS7_000700 [Eimeria intestinalis]